MNLVKWIRKNNRKIMVFVVIFSMVAFVIGSYGLKIITSMFDPSNQTIATYDDGKTIKSINIRNAQNELSVLRMLSGDRLLTVQGTGGVLLSHLIFPDSKFAGDIAAQMKQAALSGQLPISVQDLEDYFNQPVETSAVLWILLKAEAYRAGYIVSSDNAKSLLRAIVPQMTQGQGDAAQLVGHVMTQSGLTEDQIVRIYADLLTVSDYANQVMNNQAVTLNQVKATVGRSKERLDAEFVKLDAKTLIDKNAAISDTEIARQFNAFKQYAPGNPTADNPYGFGYKLPKRIQLEYMIILNDDVQAQIDSPSSEEMEQYYTNNIAQFQTSEPSDPNDPESEKIVLTKSFSEVERQIYSSIERDKTNKLTAMIFNEIKDISEAGFENVTFDEATNEQLQMAAGDYQTTAQKITNTHNITVTAGKTGWLSADDFMQEKILRTLARRQGQSRLQLSDLAFIASTEPKQKRRIGLPAIRVWENIGPVSGGYYDMENSKYHAMTALVRVVGIEDAAVPADVNVSYDTKGIAMFVKPEDKTSYSVKENVIEDLRLKKAMDTAAARAGELATLVANSSWTEAVKAYNAKYAPDAGDPNDIEANKAAIKLEMADDQTRAAPTEIIAAQRYMRENPARAAAIQRMLVSNSLNNEFYALLADDAESTGTISKTLTFEPGAACYVVKEVVRQPANETDYLDSKAQAAMQLASKDTAELALIHFSSENIIKRMNFEYKKKADAKEASQEETETTETTTE